MKKCKFCCADIPEFARKCQYCASFQDSADERKPDVTVATLVISFVGLVAALGTIAVAIFGYFGFQTINQMAEAKSTIINGLHADKVRIGKLARRELKMSTELNAVSVNVLYKRYMTIVGKIGLDYLREKRFGNMVNALRQLSQEAARFKPLDQSTRQEVVAMDALYSSVKVYQAALAKDISIKTKSVDFLHVAGILAKVPLSNIWKYRITEGAYEHLIMLSRSKGKTGPVADYYEKELSAAKEVRRLGEASPEVEEFMISRVDYASVLLQGNSPNAWKEAFKLLKEARMLAPNSSGIFYDLGEYFAREKNFKDSLGCLEVSKKYHGFEKSDVVYWVGDPVFSALLSSKAPQYQPAIQNLRNPDTPALSSLAECP